MAKKKTVIVARNKPKKARKRRGGAMTSSADLEAVRKYDNLLRDPCAADLTYPLYAGTDGGYLVRTQDVITLTATGAAMTAGTTVPCSAFVQVTPAAYTTGGTNQAYAFNAFAPGGTDPFACAKSTAGGAGGLVTNFIGSAVVGRYRPIACCLKWIPSGPYAARQGLVGNGYSQSELLSAGATATYAGVYAQCQSFGSNGSRHHEVRWLPTLADEDFRTNTGSLGAGSSIFLVLRGVDGVATSATAATISGVVEITTVYEWQPAQANNTVLGLRAPSRYKMQDLLASISDMGAYIFDGARHEAGRTLYSAGQAAARGGIRAAYNMSMGLLTSGMRTVATRGPSLLIAA